MITAAEPSWTAPFTGLSPRTLSKLVTQLRREGADVPGRGRPWRLPLADRVLLVAADWRTNLTFRQLAPLSGVSGNRHDSRGWEESGAKDAVGHTMPIADGGCQGTGLVIPYRRTKGKRLPAWKEEHNRSHKRVRARVEHAFARMKGWKILRDCRLKGDGVHHAMLGIARLHNLALTG